MAPFNPHMNDLENEFQAKRRHLSESLREKGGCHTVLALKISRGRLAKLNDETRPLQESRALPRASLGHNVYSQFSGG